MKTNLFSGRQLKTRNSSTPAVSPEKSQSKTSSKAKGQKDKFERTGSSRMQELSQGSSGKRTDDPKGALVGRALGQVLGEPITPNRMAHFEAQRPEISKLPGCGKAVEQGAQVLANPESLESGGKKEFLTSVGQISVEGEDANALLYSVFKGALQGTDGGGSVTTEPREALLNLTKKVEAMQDTVRNKRQMATTAFQNFDQKANQMYNMLSSIMKSMNEMRMGTTRNML